MHDISNLEQNTKQKSTHHTIIGATGTMVQHQIIVPVLWFVFIQLWFVAKKSTNDCSIDAFTVKHISNLNRFYLKSKCKSIAELPVQRLRCCLFIANGFNEPPPVNIRSNYNDEPIKNGIISENLSEIGKVKSKIETPPNRRSIQGITLKMALDRNGGVACRSEIRPERFTCAESLDMVHRLRSQSDAVLIGVGTAIVDNPSLLVRRNIIVDEQPLRVVIDPTLRFVVSLTASQYNINSYQLLTDGYPLAIYHCRNDTSTNPIFSNIRNQLPSSVQLHYVQPTADSGFIDTPCINVKTILDHLRAKYNVQHLMIEGGPKTAQQFLQSKLIDRCILVHAPVQFNDPVLSNITPSVLQSSNLIQLGSIQSGTDTIEYWSRPDLPWPTTDLRHWP
jgi:riboflavin biosynthesis pyrimidine reductase